MITQRARDLRDPLEQVGDHLVGAARVDHADDRQRQHVVPQLDHRRRHRPDRRALLLDGRQLVLELAPRRLELADLPRCSRTVTSSCSANRLIVSSSAPKRSLCSSGRRSTAGSNCVEGDRGEQVVDPLDPRDHDRDRLGLGVVGVVADTSSWHRCRAREDNRTVVPEDRHANAAIRRRTAAARERDRAAAPTHIRGRRRMRAVRPAQQPVRPAAAPCASGGMKLCSTLLRASAAICAASQPNAAAQRRYSSLTRWRTSAGRRWPATTRQARSQHWRQAGARPARGTGRCRGCSSGTPRAGSAARAGARPAPVVEAADSVADAVGAELAQGVPHARGRPSRPRGAATQALGAGPGEQRGVRRRRPLAAIQARRKPRPITPTSRPSSASASVGAPSAKRWRTMSNTHASSTPCSAWRARGPRRAPRAGCRRRPRD